MTTFLYISILVTHGNTIRPLTKSKHSAKSHEAKVDKRFKK